MFFVYIPLTIALLLPFVVDILDFQIDLCAQRKNADKLSYPGESFIGTYIIYITNITSI